MNGPEIEWFLTMALPDAEITYIPPGDDENPLPMEAGFTIWVVDAPPFSFQIEKARRAKWFNVRWAVKGGFEDVFAGTHLGHTVHVINNIIREAPREP
jgi:hypothetical protein